jgi:hypothetical protein
MRLLDWLNLTHLFSTIAVQKLDPAWIQCSLPNDFTDSAKECKAPSDIFRFLCSISSGCFAHMDFPLSDKLKEPIRYVGEPFLGFPYEDVREDERMTVETCERELDSMYSKWEEAGVDIQAVCSGDYKTLNSLGAKKLKQLSRVGIPMQLRPSFWYCLSGGYERKVEEPTYYKFLLDQVEKNRPKDMSVLSEIDGVSFPFMHDLLSNHLVA